MRIKVLLVDGRKVAREGLAMLLGECADIDVVGEVDDAATASKVAAAVSADVAVVLAGAFTLQVAERIRALVSQVEGLRVIALLLYLDDGVLRQALDAGATGCLSKECASAELVAAIRAVRAGEMYLNSGVANELVSRYVLARPGRATRGDKVADASLSGREWEIVRRIANGETTKEIARHLGIGTKTVETHRRRAMAKLGMHTVAGLTKFALRHGITSLEQPVSV